MIPGVGEGLRAFADDLKKSGDKDISDALKGGLFLPDMHSALEAKKKKLLAEAQAKVAESPNKPATGEQFSRALNDLIYQYKDEAATLMMTTRQKQIYEAVQKQGNTEMEKTARQYASYLDALDTEKKLLEGDTIAKTLKYRQELDNALKHNTITQKQYNDEMDKQAEAILGFSDPYTEYDNRINELDKALKNNIITWQEYSKAVQNALAKSFNVPQSIDQQVKDWQEKYNRILTLGLTEDQKRKMEKDAMPEFVKSLYESSRTPVEKFQEKMTELNAWKDKISPNLYAKGVQGAISEMGIGEHRFSQAASYGSTEARNIVMQNKTKRDDTQILQSILKMNTDQLKQLTDTATNTKRLADSTGSQLVLQLP